MLRGKAVSTETVLAILGGLGVFGLGRAAKDHKPDKEPPAERWETDDR